MKMKKRILCIFLITSMLVLTSCGSEGTADKGDDTNTTDNATTQNSSALDTSDMFSDRDLEIGYDEEKAAFITLTQDSTTATSDAVEISDNTITITDEGTYILTGTLTDGMVIISADDADDVQLVLDGVDITSSSSAAIYVCEAHNVYVTTSDDSDNKLSNGGEYIAIDDNNIDSVIFSKSDLTLNGAGTLTIDASVGHGIVSKDDLALTSGTYIIAAASHGLSGKDSVRIAGGTYTIITGKDGIHAENADDDSLGYLYIAGGTFTITAGDDGMHANTALVIDGGTIDILESYEGIEGLTIDINGGSIDLVASDDGLNAAGGNDSSGFGGHGGDTFGATEGAYICISGGSLHVDASGDGIDSNGDLTVTGGETYVSGPTDGGNGALDYAGDASISGGIFIAAGSTGMAQNFGSDSTQGAMMVTVDSGSAGSTITLTDSDGATLVSWQADKEYASVVISTPDIIEGSTYTLTTGVSTTSITMSSLIYGSGSEGGMGGGFGGGHGGHGNGGDHGRR